jgi:phosphatidylinositol-3-phosphatase
MTLNRNWIAFGLAGILVLSGCSSGSSAQPPVKEPNVTQPAAKGKLPVNIDHVVVVIEENHAQQEIQGNPSAPYMNALMKQGANFVNYHAIEHPSQPNYLDLFSGANQGVTNDKVPQHQFSSANLGSELQDKGYTFGGFSEDLPAVGFNGASHASSWLPGKAVYARKHNPWVNFTNIPAKANQPLSSFPTNFSQLPTVSFVIPNLDHDMHDGSIQDADKWLKQHIDPYAQWAMKNNSMLIVTWDEDDQSQNNQIPTMFFGPMVKQGTYRGEVNHYQLLRTLEDLYGLSYGGKSQSVQPIRDVWK